MSRNYKFHKLDARNFVSFAVVDWQDVFTRNEYKNILLESPLCWIGRSKIKPHERIRAGAGGEPKK